MSWKRCKADSILCSGDIRLLYPRPLALLYLFHPPASLPLLLPPVKPASSPPFSSSPFFPFLVSSCVFPYFLLLSSSYAVIYVPVTSFYVSPYSSFFRTSSYVATYPLFLSALFHIHFSFDLLLLLTLWHISYFFLRLPTFLILILLLPFDRVSHSTISTSFALSPPSSSL